jgi:hypothetical protein
VVGRRPSGGATVRLSRGWSSSFRRRHCAASDGGVKGSR